MAQLTDQTPLDLMEDAKCNNFINTGILSQSHNFETQLSTRTSTFPNISPTNSNASDSTYVPLHSQQIPNNPVVPNLQVKNVSLPVQNPTTVIISSPNMQHNAQPLVYTSLPVDNQHIILQQANSKSQAGSPKSGPVILQNIQQPVLLQAKLIKGDTQVFERIIYIINSYLFNY